ncbi:NAD(P)/FAD-dependent oxidoreductase [Bacillus thuringiensis]|uniref:NAD(P)/FAD-dependent oxidoreductase n=1 Tax=Bacillus thuringiensis TaxID=1428 RepID=UPI0021D65F2B|nr:NAD(P)/FAD-dependent oxidoreductase [Bacillus thuringiensis]MCU7667032.1 NAD(P)/FAD-dependent oxidoreductase [Bacillus thuringiensis]
MSKSKVVILGAGYGGMLTALTLQKKMNKSEVDITLVNKNDYHYFTTELHQPAAGTFPAEKTRVLIRELINTNKINFIKDEAIEIKTEEKKVILSNSTLEYDYLVVGLGGESETFGIPGLKENAFGKWTFDGAVQLRNHIENQFANYNNQSDNKDSLSIVVGGAGFTGIEFVSEIAERVPSLCKKYNVSREKVRIVCVEAAPTVLPGFDEDLVKYATERLKRKGIEFFIGTPIKECNEKGVILANGEEIKASTVVWAAGVRGSSIIEKSGFENVRGRVGVNEFLQAPGFENVFIIGDSSYIMNEETGRPYPPTAQIAMQMGANLGQNLTSIINGKKEDLISFKPQIKGTVASLGRKDAIGVVGKRKVYGFVATSLKKVIDLRYLFIIGGIKLVLKKGRF